MKVNITSNNFNLSENLIDKLNIIFLAILESEGLQEGNINLSFISSDKMKGLNKKFRSINKDTNVLSFENQDISRSHTKDLGDVAISYQYVVEEAISKKIKLNDHIAHMFIHGVFHILGYDHENNQDAEKMELKEIEFLSKLNIINPYNI